MQAEFQIRELMDKIIFTVNVILCVMEVNFPKLNQIRLFTAINWNSSSCDQSMYNQNNQHPYSSASVVGD